VFVNTGVNDRNVDEQLAIADGAVVGTFFKRDGVFENPVDRARVERLMAAVRALREASRRHGPQPLRAPVSWPPKTGCPT
jgi:predicted TIM-barrel enzyme